MNTIISIKHQSKYLKIFWVATFMVISISCTQKEEPTPVPSNGRSMLLIGNSFFRPYAEKLNDMAIDAGFENHHSTTVFRGGENGRPINFWNDTNTNEHAEIKARLDAGGVEIFGMTAGHDIENPSEGHRAWVSYALQNNPDIIIFIAIPPIDFPEDWEQRAQDYGFDTIQELYTYFVKDIVHNGIVAQLRTEFPTTKIFTIPTGWAAINLAQMQKDNELLDQIDLFGPKSSSIFTDQKGHQGDIVIETGGLIWLNSLYQVNLQSHVYETGFTTDLHEIANQIMENHDSNYKL